VEILYAGQAIMGSPFYVEIYDPNKIRVEGTRKGMVGQRMEFDSRSWHRVSILVRCI
jgi:filamin